MKKGRLECFSRAGCRIKDGWHEAGKEGVFCGILNVNGRRWAVVKWDDEKDPDMHKAEGVEISSKVWTDC